MNVGGINLDYPQQISYWGDDDFAVYRMLNQMIDQWSELDEFHMS